MSLLELQDVTVAGLKGPRLEQVSLSIQPGEHVMIVGPNGAGKSTLLSVLRGRVLPEHGEARLEGQAPHGGSARDRAAKLAWLPQAPKLEEGLCALEVVAAARFRFGETRAVAQRHAAQALRQIGAEDLMNRPMTALSGGEAQRVRLASLWAQEAKVWLLDEPTNHLDPALRFELVETLSRVGRAGTSLIWVTHDLTLIPQLDMPETRVLGLDAGRKAFELPADDPSLPSRLGDLFAVTLETVPSDRGPRWVVTRGEA